MKIILETTLGAVRKAEVPRRATGLATRTCCIQGQIKVHRIVSNLETYIFPYGKESRELIKAD